MAVEDQPVPRPRQGGRPGRSATIDEALDALPDGGRVYVAAGCGVPTQLLDAMAERPDRWTALEILTDYLLEPLRLFRHAPQPFRLTSLQPSRAVDPMREAGALATVPSSLRHYGRLTSPGGLLSLDAVVVQVAPPGPSGRFSLGTNVGIAIELMANSPLVIAEVNPRMPYTFGAGEIDRDEIDLLVDVDHPLVELLPVPVDETSATIGALVAGEIPDRATVQFGIGAIPTAALEALVGHRDLGLHGGMIGDAVIGLHESGALTGVDKATWPGRMVTGAVIGSAPVFEFVDRNPDVVMVPSTVSHGVDWLGRLERFCAINSAVEISLDGSINAEMAGDRVLSGPGGQPDYAIGAAESPGGVSIVAFPSTAGRSRRSRIVRRLTEGATVTVARSLADVVITEHGVARLRGRSLAGRAEALRAIADPAARPDLGI